MDSSKPDEQVGGSKPVPPEGSCHFFIERKKRFCRFKPAKDSNYCAEHVTAFQNEQGRKRMICPFDPKHTCYVDKLTHHKNRCPSRPKEMPAYYNKGINAGDDAGELVPEPKVTVLTVMAEELQTIIDKVNKLYDEFLKAIPVDILSHQCLKEEMENTSYGTAALRHRKQMASLIGHMEKLKLLKSGMCYVEMGAGKGQLTHWLHRAVEDIDNTKFVLIDRSHVRNKMDNLHKEEEIMTRYRIDIEDLKLGGVPAIESEDRPVVSYGKHLCGPATDLALRCATEILNQDSKTENGAEEPKRKKHKSGQSALAGCVIALCCHHRCTWPAYVGKQFFLSCGLTARDFQLLSSMSSWATCTWKGWSHTKKTEDDQTKTESDAKDLTGHGHESADECDIHYSCDETSEHSHGTRLKKPVIDASHQYKENELLDHMVKQSTENLVEQGNEEIKGVPDTNKKACCMESVEGHDLRGSGISKSINTQLSEKEREEIGRKCKHLIDYGRVRYLEEHGLTSSLCVYIEDFYTPENVALLARLK